jgi:hypothetical protein
MRPLYRLPLFFVLALFIIGTPSLRAGWLQEDVAVCSNPGYQHDPVIVADGAGSSFVAWEDYDWNHYSGSSIYAQKLGPDGAPLWTADGVNATTNGADQAIQPDGAGGAFVAFRRDTHGGTFDCPIAYSRMYVERLDATGSLLWSMRITTDTDLGRELDLRMFPDGAGGVIVLWMDGTLYWEPWGCDWWDDFHILAQRIDANGNRLWGPSPLAVSLEDLKQGQLSATREESGDIIVVWTTYKNSCFNLCAQKMDVEGNRLWGDNGATVICYTAGQQIPRVASDGAGGAVVAWLDERASTHVYAQRLDASGTPRWTPLGVPVCTVDGAKSEIRITEGTSGSAIVHWVMPVGGVSALFAQRLDHAGAPLWDPNGKQISDALHPCRNAYAIPDGEGGAVFAWERIIPQPKNSIICGLWGLSPSDIFAVGDNGLIVHFDGVSWTMMGSPTSNHLHGIWGTAHDNIYAVGANSTIIHFDGSVWRKETYPTVSTQLYGVWGSGPDDIWVVGTSKQRYHWDGTSWQSLPYETNCDFYGVHGTSSSNVYMVGTQNSYCLCLHYDGATWTKSVMTTPGILHSVWVSPDDRVFAGSSDQLLRKMGSGWNIVGFDEVGMGFNLWGTDTTNVYCVFDGGYLAHWDGAAATIAQASTNKLYGTWGTSGNDIWISGASHTIRHLVGAEWVTQNQLNSDIFMSKVDSSGNVLWNDYGAHATVNNDDQTSISIAPDASGNALLAWLDGRTGNWDVFARKVSICRGPLVATELMSFNTELLDAGIEVTWLLSQYDEGASFEISRTAGGATGDAAETWEAIEPAISRDDLSFAFVDGDVEPGTRYRYRVGISDGKGSRTLFETDIVSAPRLPLTLFQNVPNPFNPSTTIRYYVPERCRVKVAIYDVAGRTIASLEDRDRPPGHYSLEWNGRDNLGKPAASGIYFCRLQAGKEMRSRKMVLLR